VTAGLPIASFVRVMSIEKGYDVERVIALNMSLPSAKYPKTALCSAFCQRVLEKVTAMPGVQIDIVGTEHDTRPLLEKPSTNVRFVSPVYFRTLKRAEAVSDQQSAISFTGARRSLLKLSAES
jgi:hypothetical protein